MRWTRLFDDLDGQLEAAERADRAAESADLRRLESSRLTLSERFAAAQRSEVTLTLDGADRLTGSVTRVGSDWVLLEVAAGSEVLVALAAVTTVTGLPAVSAAPADEIDGRLGIAVLLRQLARDRLPVTVCTRTGAAYTGTVDRVGADFVDLAEHAADRPRRATDVSRVRTIASAAIAVVRPA